MGEAVGLLSEFNDGNKVGFCAKSWLHWKTCVGAKILAFKMHQTALVRHTFFHFRQRARRLFNLHKNRLGVRPLLEMDLPKIGPSRFVERKALNTLNSTTGMYCTYIKYTEMQLKMMQKLKPLCFRVKVLESNFSRVQKIY